MKISPIDIAALNGDDPMCGELWLETGSPWPQEDEQARVDFETSANFDPVPEQ